MSSRGESGAGSGRRRRRTPEAAEREIVEAAEALLREKPFRELTVDDLMRRTGLSRPSFYVYFRDKHDLVLKVVEHIGGELFAMSERWYAGTGDGPALVREAIDGVVGVFAEHGPVLRALADAASEDARVEAAYVAILRAVRGRDRAAHRGGDRGGARAAAGPGADRHRAHVDDGALPAAGDRRATRARRSSPSRTR